jgi:hypothetical protein
MRASLAVVLAAVALAACGSSSNNSSKAPASAGQSPEAQIKANWISFFSLSTPNSERATLLQNGQQFAPVIAAFSNNPLAKGISVKVSDVKLTGPTTATVTYSLLLAGKPVPGLTNTTGTAVKSGNTWLVGDASFCQLVKLGGVSPPGCSKA